MWMKQLLQKKNNTRSSLEKDNHILLHFHQHWWLFKKLNNSSNETTQIHDIINYDFLSTLHLIVTLYLQWRVENIRSECREIRWPLTLMAANTFSFPTQLHLNLRPLDLQTENPRGFQSYVPWSVNCRHVKFVWLSRLFCDITYII